MSDNINYYQTIPELGIKGRMDTPKEFDAIGLPKDLTDKSVLDIGCNIGAFLYECWKRKARTLYGVESNTDWWLLAQGVAKRAEELSELEDRKIEYYIEDDIDNIYCFNEEYKKEGNAHPLMYFDLVLLLSVTHVAEKVTGQELLNKAYECTKPGGLLIIEVNDRLQKEQLILPKEAVLYGQSKDSRSVYHCIKSNT